MQDAGESEYCPLIIYVNGTPYTGATMAELKNNVETAIGNYFNTYDTNVNLADQTSNDLIVSWSWPFEVGTGAELKENDRKDTILGDAAAATHAATIELTVTCTVTQVN